ncbi:hypothetical protein D9M70_562640 [compost metagenome]
MLDHQHGEVGRQIGQRLLDAAGIALRHAGSWLVEQQHPRFQRQGDGYLQQSLLAIGDLAHLAVHQFLEAELAEKFLNLGHDIGHAEKIAEETTGAAAPLKHGKRNMLGRRHVGKKPRHLERAHKPAPNAANRVDAGHGLAGDAHFA